MVVWELGSRISRSSRHLLLRGQVQFGWFIYKKKGEGIKGRKGWAEVSGGWMHDAGMVEVQRPQCMVPVFFCPVSC